MNLQSQITDVVVQIATDINQINANVGTLDNLPTEDKTSLVNAMVELKSSIGTGGSSSGADIIDDSAGQGVSDKTWSADKLTFKLRNMDTLTTSNFSLIFAKVGDESTLTTSNKTSVVDAINEVNAKASAGSSSPIDDQVYASTTKTWSSNKILGEIQLAVGDLAQYVLSDSIPDFIGQYVAKRDGVEYVPPQPNFPPPATEEPDDSGAM